MRKVLNDVFLRTKFNSGKYHWNEEKWFLKVERFLNNTVGFVLTTKFEVAATVILLNPSLGPISYSKDGYKIES